MDKKPLIGVMLCFILFMNIVVPIQVESKKVDCEVKEESSIYFFHFAFVTGEYENCWKWFDGFRIWNSNYSIKSIDVLGFSSYQGKFFSVKAFNVDGSLRIGFIGQHHCCIFAFGHGGVTVDA